MGRKACRVVRQMWGDRAWVLSEVHLNFSKSVILVAILKNSVFARFSHHRGHGDAFPMREPCSID